VPALCSRKGCLPTPTLPADERGSGEVVRALLQGCYGGSGALQVVAGGPRRTLCGLRQQAPEACKHYNALLECRELLLRPGRILGNMCSNEGSNVSGGLYPTLSRAPGNGSTVPGAQTNRDPVRRGA